MNTYEQAAERLRGNNFCEGCPFVREVLRIAYAIDNPAPLPANTPEHISRIHYGSPRGVLSYRLSIAAILGTLNETQECRGTVRRDFTDLPDWLTKIAETLSIPEVMCGLEDRHIKTIKLT